MTIRRAGPAPTGEHVPLGTVPRWALPGELTTCDGEPPARRTVRDWLVDAVLFLVAVAGWLWGWRDLVVSPDPGYLEQLSGWMITVDPWVGAAACLAVWWRRRFPLALAVAMVPALAVAGTATTAVLISIFTVAVHRGWLAATLVTAAQAGQAVWFMLTWQPPGLTAAGAAVTVFLMFVTPLACGMVVRFRRQLIVSLRRDAQRQQREHAQRLVEAGRAERERIAREMHDVLAHRISLLSVHAGALAYRTSQADRGAGQAVTPAELTGAVQVIRDNAHQALTELGEVLSVLRADQPDGAGDPDRTPPPQLTDIPRLVDEACSAGQRVTLDLDGVRSAVPPPRLPAQRTAYRVVQEGLTNARKHAPHGQVTVRVTGAPETGLAVVVSSPLPVGAGTGGIPGAGAGLAGLAERVALDGGTLDHGPVDGSFRLVARLPWVGPASA